MQNIQSQQHLSRISEQKAQIQTNEEDDGTYDDDPFEGSNQGVNINGNISMNNLVERRRQSQAATLVSL